jgi:pteridine reductase
MNKLALITGGARRLGRSFALAAARMGYDILLHYHSSEEGARETAAEIEAIGVKSFVCKADLTAETAIAGLFATVDECLRSDRAAGGPPYKFTLLVNSAAVMPAADSAAIDVRDWDLTLDLNLRAPFLLAREAFKRMPAGGLIVNITDSGAGKAWSRYPSYTVSKAGLESLTKILARAFAPKVRVNAIAPGLVLPSAAISQKEWESLIGRLPLKRPGSPQELASALEFLIQNEYLTGQTVVVDGGYSLI